MKIAHLLQILERRMNLSGQKILLVAVALVFSASAEAASVKSVKKRVLDVDLEEGETFEKGAEVCVFADSGAKVACGQVTKVKNSVMRVKLEASKKIKKIKPGMAVKSSESEESGSGSGEASADGSGSDKSDVEEKSPKKESKRKPSTNPFRIVGAFAPAISTPSKYNKILYNPPVTGTTPVSLWTKDKPIKSALFGFDFSVAVPLGERAIVPGVRYRAFTPSLIDSDYNPNQQNPYVSTEQKATSLGLWVDYDYLRLTPTPIFALNFLAGLDIDMSTVTVKAVKKDDGANAPPETVVVDLTSKLSILSLRLGVDTDLLFLKVAGGRIGLTFSIPVVAFGAKTTTEVGADEARGLADETKDVEASLGHSKNSFGLEAQIGGILAF